MYAVFTEGRLSYLGECRDEAVSTFNTKPNSTLHNVDDVDELNDLLDEADGKAVVDELSDNFKILVEKLDSIGINEDLATKVKEGGTKLLGEVRSLGIKGMQVVGDGFVALGELLKNTSFSEFEEHDPLLDDDHHKHEHGGES